MCTAFEALILKALNNKALFNYFFFLSLSFQLPLWGFCTGKVFLSRLQIHRDMQVKVFHCYLSMAKQTYELKCCVRIGVLSACCLLVYHACAHAGQMKVSDSLELAESRRVDAGSL